MELFTRLCGYMNNSECCPCLGTLAIIAITVLILYYWNSSKNDWIDTTGKAVLVTGCDSGIGYQAAIHFATLGFRVFAGCLQPEEESTKKLKEASDRIILIKLDVTKEDTLKVAFAKVQEILNTNHENLWAVVNNAGICIMGMFDWVTMPQSELMIEVNLLGAIRVVRTFLPLVKQSKGRIVLVSSIAAKMPIPGTAVYNSTKAGLESLGDTLRMELAMQDVTVCIVEPGNYSRQTKLLQYQEKHSQDQWKEMSQEDQEKDKDFFKAFFNSVDIYQKKKLRPNPEKDSDFSLILYHLQHAVQSIQPQSRYLSAKGVEAFVVKIVGLLSTKWKDKVITALVKKSWKLKIE